MYSTAPADRAIFQESILDSTISSIHIFSYKHHWPGDVRISLYNITCVGPICRYAWKLLVLLGNTSNLVSFFQPKYYFALYEFFTKILTGRFIFLWSLTDTKSLMVSRSLLRIPTDLNLLSAWSWFLIFTEIFPFSFFHFMHYNKYHLILTCLIVFSALCRVPKVILHNIL